MHKQYPRMTRSQRRSGPTKVIFALLAFLILFSLVCSPVSADDNSVACPVVSADDNSVACPVVSADDISLPPTLEEYREMYGDAPQDVIDYYTYINTVCAGPHNTVCAGPHNTVCAGLHGTVCGTGGDSSPSGEDCYVRKNDYWYRMPQITDPKIEKYYHLIQRYDAKTQFKIARDEMTDDIRAQILAILGKPEKTGWWESAWITTQWMCWHPTQCAPKDGERYGGKWNPDVFTQKLYDKYGDDVETMTAKVREDAGDWLHPWTDPTLIVPNPYDYPTLQAAARDFGTYDGSLVGYALGRANCEPHLPNPHAFDSIKFPSGEGQLRGVYPQVYASAFAKALIDGYKMGQDRHSTLVEDQRLYLQEIQAKCACIQAVCTLSSMLGKMAAAA